MLSPQDTSNISRASEWKEVKEKTGEEALESERVKDNWNEKGIWKMRGGYSKLE